MEASGLRLLLEASAGDLALADALYNTALAALRRSFVQCAQRNRLECWIL
jgi:hypothetical protein